MFVYVSPETWTGISAVAGMISALAAFATVWIAVRAFREARKDKLADDEARRPDFAMHGSISVIEQNESHYLELIFQNLGENPAMHISARVLLMGPPYDGKNNHHFVKDIVNVIHKISSFSIHEGLRLKQEGAQHFLIVELQYRDGRTKKDVSQNIYRKWTGFKALTAAYFEEVSSDELEFMGPQAQKFLSK